ncbi:MAG: hypothetical protein AAFW81_00630 [Pseudomonadota bacterium]
MRFLFVFALMAVLAPSPGQTADRAADPATAAEIQRMLDAVGGRDVWRRAHGFTMTEVLYTDQLETPVVREYWVDFRTPRIMEKAVGNGLRQTRALNREAGWTDRNGALEAWSDEEVAGWRSFWPGIPTRVFHLLASEDDSVEARWRDGVLDIYIDGEWAVWIANDEDGTPVAYGRDERHTDTHFLGKALPYGDVTLWSEAIEPGGDWRVVMVDYELLYEPHEVSFDQPR